MIATNCDRLEIYFGSQHLTATPDTAALHWILRGAVAACFIGHGAFGIITKKVTYFVKRGRVEKKFVKAAKREAAE